MTQLSTDAPEAATNLPEFSVGDLARALKGTIEAAYGQVRVRGEISGFKRAASGHLYMALKDADAVLDAVCWRGTAPRLGVAPEDGMEVVCTGRLTTYMARSRYQLIIEAMQPAGEGALLKMLEARRRKLAAEGLFDAERKRPLPFLPELIGVVTSPTGAVIRDILHRLAERFPRRVLLWPVLVQGEAAAAQVAAAIDGFNRLAADGPVPRPELIIVARGGGSLEDLWAFNEEIVVRAAAASEIPLISAVGHEADTTLIDLAADMRAPTPSAAAEMAVPVRAELLARLIDDARRLVGAAFRMVDERRLRVEGLGRGLPEPRRLLDEATQRLDDRGERLVNAGTVFFERCRAALARIGPRLGVGPRHAVAEHTARFQGVAERLQARWLRGRLDDGRRRLDDQDGRLRAALARAVTDAGRRLEAAHGLLRSISYQRVLERGFALVRDAKDRPIGSVAKTRPGMAVSLQFHDGAAAAMVAGAPAKPARKPPPDDESQGRLL